METLFTSLLFCGWNPTVNGGFHSQTEVMQIIDVAFGVSQKAGWTNGRVACNLKQQDIDLLKMQNTDHIIVFVHIY